MHNVRMRAIKCVCECVSVDPIHTPINHPNPDTHPSLTKHLMNRSVRFLGFYSSRSNVDCNYLSYSVGYYCWWGIWIHSEKHFSKHTNTKFSRRKNVYGSNTDFWCQFVGRVALNWGEASERSGSERSISVANGRLECNCFGQGNPRWARSKSAHARYFVVKDFGWCVGSVS